MESNLQVEIQQKMPFSSLQEELWLNLSRTTASVGHAIERRLRPHGLSPTQYNVLRILRGASADGLCQYEIAARLVARVPDVPRILERMERAGWVRRTRGVEDRRLMVASLTPCGLKLAGVLDGQMEALTAGAFAEMPREQMEQLNDLLVAARQPVERE